MSKHRVKISLQYIDGTTIPWKWKGQCTSCNWTCLSWQWQREDGSGTLLMANEHYAENHK